MRWRPGKRRAFPGGRIPAFAPAKEHGLSGKKGYWTYYAVNRNGGNRPLERYGPAGEPAAVAVQEADLIQLEVRSE